MSLLDVDIDYSDEKVLINTIIKYLPWHLKEKIKYSNINVELKTPYKLNRIRRFDHYHIYYETLYEYVHYNEMYSHAHSLELNEIYIHIFKDDEKKDWYQPLHKTLKDIYEVYEPA